MKTIQSIVFALCIAASASAERILIPAAGTGPGAAGSQWATDLTIHNAGIDPVTVTLTFHDASGRVATSPLTLEGRSTVTRSDIVRSIFGLEAATGALTLDGSAHEMAKLVTSVHVYNSSDAGEFGQEIPSYRVDETLGAGTTAVIAGPSRAADSRLNFGIFAIDATVVEWTLVRNDGAVAATARVEYAAETHRQYNRGVETLFAAAPEDNDVIYVKVISGRAIPYGSIVNDRTNDPTFVRAGIASNTLAVRFLGVDLDENGTVDIFDADRDGRLDAAVEVITGSFPNYFRIAVEDPETRQLTFSLVNGPRDAEFIDRNGTLLWYPAHSLKGTTTSLTVRVSDGTETIDVVIPIVFR